MVSHAWRGAPADFDGVSTGSGAAGEAVRPYTKESLLRYDLDEDDETGEEGEESEEWEGETETPEAEPRMFETPAEPDEEFEE